MRKENSSHVTRKSRHDRYLGANGHSVCVIYVTLCPKLKLIHAIILNAMVSGSSKSLTNFQ